MSTKGFTKPGQESVSLLLESSLLKQVEDHSSRFARDGYVRLPRLFGTAQFNTLQSEIARLRKYANNKNFTMPGFETLRRMSTLGGKKIRKQSTILTNLYENRELRSVVSKICGREIFTCNDENEWQVVNWLEGPGETHGWHLDDPPLALVIFIKSPHAAEGGILEFINEWRQLCAELGHDPERDVTRLVEHCFAAHLMNSKAHSTGDAYLLRADKCLHRVTPLAALRARRTVLNLAFEFEPDVRRIGETAALLYENSEILRFS